MVYIIIHELHWIPSAEPMPFDTPYVTAFMESSTFRVRGNYGAEGRETARRSAEIWKGVEQRLEAADDEDEDEPFPKKSTFYLFDEIERLHKRAHEPDYRVEYFARPVGERACLYICDCL